MSELLTVLYYTANREKPAFEERVRARLKGVAGHLPIISVSQEPIDLGENICVGKQECTYGNEHRQIQIGAEAAKTPWIAVAEADFVYTPAYFALKPDLAVNAYYRYSSVWIAWENTRRYGPLFRRKVYSEGAQIVHRIHLLRRLKQKLRTSPKWSAPGEDYRPALMYRTGHWAMYGDPEQPVVSFKTWQGGALKSNTGTMPIVGRDELPYWGTANDLRREFFA